MHSGTHNSYREALYVRGVALAAQARAREIYLRPSGEVFRVVYVATLLELFAFAVPVFALYRLLKIEFDEPTKNAATVTEWSR